MRRVHILVFLLIVPMSGTAASFEARSPRHMVSIEPVSLDGGDVRYDVTISDVATGKVLGKVSATPSRTGVRFQRIEAGVLHIAVQVGDDGTSLTANIEFEQDGDVIDEIRANWMLKSRRVRLHATNAVRVGGDVKAPVVLKRVEPVYVEEARKARISGIVIVEVVIDRTGHVTDGVVLKPLAFLSDSALDAVKQWVFAPGTLNGSPVDVIFNLTVNFKLDPPLAVEN
jgi:TonB family C-terminal domain